MDFLGGHMKKYLIISVLLTALLWTVAYVVADEGIEFDPKLEKYLLEEYDTTDLSKDFVQSIEILDVSHLDLTSAKGLEHFTNLKELDASNNLLTDSAFLKGLDNLVVLDLSFNQFKDIELSSTDIEHLDLEANQLTTINFVQSLEKLTRLNLRANNVLDLASLRNLKSLIYLNLRGNKVKDLEPLVGHNQLLNLNVRNNQIHSVEPIVHLPLDRRLYISGNEVADLSLLEDKIKDIEEVDFEIGISAPSFSVQSGAYEESFHLEFEEEDGVEVYYTLDGSKPNVNSNKYDSPIEISSDALYNQPIYSNTKTSPHREGFSFDPTDVKKAIVVTAVSYKDYEYSDPVSSTYILDPDLVIDNELPIISLTVSPRDLFDEYDGIYVPGITFNEEDFRTGNYYQRGEDFEKEAVVEFFHGNGSLNFKQNIGLRINGNYTRRLPQKSLRLYPRSEYGQSKIYYDGFDNLPYNEFNRLVLRNSGNDYNSTMLRDGLMSELVKDGNIDVQAYQPSIVLINGEYWGIHNIREKFTADYIETKYNIKEDQLVMMDVYQGGSLGFDMQVGSESDKVHYEQLVEYVEENDMSRKENVEYIETLMDIDNFLEYVAIQVYYANTDSFGNNLSLWRKKVDYNPEAPHGHDGRWRWMLFDLDFGMGYGLLRIDDDPITYNMVKHVLSDHYSMVLFRNLMENEDIQAKFINQMLTLLNSKFEPDRVKEKIDELSSNIRLEMPESITRWENIESMDSWEKNLEILYEFAERRPEIVKDHLMEEFGLTESDLSEIEQE